MLEPSAASAAPTLAQSVFKLRPLECDSKQFYDTQSTIKTSFGADWALVGEALERHVVLSFFAPLAFRLTQTLESGRRGERVGRSETDD